MTSVVRERDDGKQCWSHILFDSGERVLISVAGKPTPSIKVLKLAFAGLVPVKTIWELTPAKAGGNHAYVHFFVKMLLAIKCPFRLRQFAMRFFSALRSKKRARCFWSASLL